MTRGVQFKRRMQRLLIHLILIIFSIIMIVPFVWMTLTAFKTVTEATSVSPFVIFPSQWRTDAFTTVWNNMTSLFSTRTHYCSYSSELCVHVSQQHSQDMHLQDLSSRAETLCSP